MKFVNNGIRLSPTDLANYAACAHLTTLDLAVIRGDVEAPNAFSVVTDALRRRGEAHETAYVESLKVAGLSVIDLRDHGLDADGDAATRRAMAEGAERIVQAPLLQDGWAGRADVLVCVDRQSLLGGWSYEPLDTKLARETRGSAMLQLCAYASALEHIQGVAPEFVHVVSPGQPFATYTYRLAEYAAYFRLVRNRLLSQIQDRAPTKTYPDPVAHCDLCRWNVECNARRRADDHLSLVAGIRNVQIAQLQGWNVTTLAGLAQLPVPLERKPDRGSAEALVRVREQARVQFEGRTRGAPVFELLKIEPDIGLCLLPQPSRGDIFFDIEGDPFVPDSGREYLFGWAYVDDQDEPVYRSLWGLSESDEKRTFEQFVDFVLKRWQHYPDLHIYHYAPYEPSALKRLMGRHATREDEVDRLLRAERFVDLYTVIRHALRASVERYSIKSLEVFYGYRRAIPLVDVGAHQRSIEAALEFNDVGSIPKESLTAVETYNKDDCLSALELRRWLEGRRADLITSGAAVPRPPDMQPEENKPLTEKEARIRELMLALMHDVPVERSDRSPEQHARWLLAQMLEFHRREDKADWWDFFRLSDLPKEDYLDDPGAIGDLTFVARVGGTDRSPIHRYRYPIQELSAPCGDVHIDRKTKVGSVEDYDLRERTIDVKKTMKSAGFHPERVFFFDHVHPAPIPDALYDIAASIRQHGMDAGPHDAVRELLLNRPPRLRAGAEWERAGESIVDRATRLVVDLDRAVLPVQGPPGAGKTYLGAHMICRLIEKGRRIGVTATSHKVIRHLLNTVRDEAAKKHLSVRCLHKISGDVNDDEWPIRETSENAEALDALTSGEAHVVAGTAWMWARADFENTVDVLFVDEAGQMSLANVIAAGRATRNIVLLGDPQQLEQPLQGSHPEGTAVSALQHVLGPAKTMPPNRGLFLPETWRLAPSITAFTSDVFYEGRLASRAGLDVQRLISPAGFNGSGLWFLPIAHAGNQNASPEEADSVRRLVEQLRSDHEWVDQKSKLARVDWKDILIVSPYNAQVSAIQELLPHARVGTVDRFQGQEGAVVIYSAATSSPEDAPRGMEFLYSLNRLNVATSRARCAVILVASPSLLDPDCQTPRQMQLANALCRFTELASVVGIGS